jgi:hypothetical protein
VTIAAALINSLLPPAQKDVPVVDPSAGQALSIGPDGCGSTILYAWPSSIGPFVETVAIGRE